jgi:hypothetical protein
VCTCPNGDHDGRVTQGYLFNCLQHAEPFLETRGTAGAVLSQKVGVGAQVTRGDPRAAPSRGAATGAAGTHGSPGAAPSREAGAVTVGIRGSPGVNPRPGGRSRSHCLDLKLVCGVPDTQGTNSGPRAHPRRGCEPTGGANIPFPCSLSKSCTLGFRSGGAARLIRGNP